MPTNDRCFDRVQREPEPEQQGEEPCVCLKRVNFHRCSSSPSADLSYRLAWFSGSLAFSVALSLHFAKRARVAACVIVHLLYKPYHAPTASRVSTRLPIEWDGARTHWDNKLKRARRLMAPNANAHARALGGRAPFSARVRVSIPHRPEFGARHKALAASFQIVRFAGEVRFEFK